MTWWKGLLAALIVAGLVAVTIAGARERPTPPTEVQKGEVKRGPITRTVTGAGKVQAATTVKISSNLSGDLIELDVKEGDKVTKGQVLGRLDRRRYEASTRQAQSAMNAAKSDVATAQVDVDRIGKELARIDALVEKGMASKAEAEKSTSDLLAARARVAALQDRTSQAAAFYEESVNNLSKTVLLSPIDGTVIEMTREVGERVRGSDFNEDVVMTLAALNLMEVKIEVGEHEVVHLKQAQKSEIKVDALEGQTFEGSVVEIAQKALIRNPGTEQETTSFPVTVALAIRPPGVMPGMSAEVKIIADQRDNAVIVPVQAVTVRPEAMLQDNKPESIEGGKQIINAPKGEQFAKVVFVVDDQNKVQVRRVRTGIASDTNVEIIEGLKEGEHIVEGPYRTLAKDLKDGDTIEEGKGKGKGGARGFGPSRG